MIVKCKIDLVKKLRFSFGQCIGGFFFRSLAQSPAIADNPLYLRNLCRNLAQQYPKYFIEEPLASKMPHELSNSESGGGGLDDEYWWYSENGNTPWSACTYKLAHFQQIFDDDAKRVYNCGGRKILYDKNDVDLTVIDKLGIPRKAKYLGERFGNCVVQEKVRLFSGMVLSYDERATTFSTPWYFDFRVDNSDFTFTTKRLLIWTIKEKIALPKPVF